jgi:hypothetical protein
MKPETCNVKAHTRSMPARKPRLNTATHLKLASEIASRNAHRPVRVKELRLAGKAVR